MALLLTGPLVGATPNASVSNAATALGQLADRSWQREATNDYNLRAQLGEPIELIRPINYANADQDAAFAQSILIAPWKKSA